MLAITYKITSLFTKTRPLLCSGLLALLLAVSLSSTASATFQVPSGSPSGLGSSSSSCSSGDTEACFCGNKGASPTDCEDPASDPNADCTKNDCDFITQYINPAINLLSVLFGLIAVISLILGGIRFSASGDDPQKVSLAKKRIADTLVAIVVYFFLYGFLEFLIPGGLFH
jgi:hypothetical protein